MPLPVGKPGVYPFAEARCELELPVTFVCGITQGSLLAEANEETCVGTPKALEVQSCVP